MSADSSVPPGVQEVASPVTVRAVCLGLLLSGGINLVMAYNDFYLYNSLLIGNFFPVISIAIVFVLVIGSNWLGQRRNGFFGFSAGELLLIWSMIGIAGGICSAGVMRYFPSWMIVPAYYTTASNEYGTYILKYLPDWMVVSKDSESNAVKWFMEGLPVGASIPWRLWVVPMATWGAFMVLLYCSNFALVSMFFNQWSVRERLIFPLVHLPLELTREAPKGRILNDFLRNRMTWIGFAIPCFIWGIKGLRSYFPGVPDIPMDWSTWGLFADRPWSEFNMGNARTFFTIIGLTFLLTTEIALSLWFFFFLYRLSYVFVAWLGAGATGFWGNWDASLSVFETTGVVLVIAGFLFYTARHALKGWLDRAWHGRVDREQDPLKPRVALVLIVLGVGGMIGWFMLAGASWWVSVLTVILFLAVILVMTRLVVEAGLVFVQTKISALDLATGLFPAGWLSGFSLNAMNMHKCTLMYDMREILMPFVMNGMKAAAVVRMHMGKVLAVFALTALMGLSISAYGRIATGYKYGSVNMDQWANVMSPDWFQASVAKFQKTPPEYEWITVGENDVIPTNLAHIITGGTITAALLFLRAKFLWWPLHPFGLVTCCAFAMSSIWWSVFLGWLCKASVMTFGGAGVYRKLLPLFLGLVLGESLIGALWMILGMVTGTPGLTILPN